MSNEPLIPSDIDLRGLPWMRLDVIRLMDSDLFALSSGDEFKAAVALWCKSWHQTPAGSLPDDDRVLAHLSGAGSRWKKLRAMALRGWVKCSDGRLYHDVIADQVLLAWQERQRHLTKREQDSERLKQWRDAKRQKGELAKTGGLKDVPRGTETRNETADETKVKRVSDDVRNANETSKTGRDGTVLKDIPPTAGVPPPDPLFGFGLDLLKSKNVADGAARSFLGLMRKTVGDSLAFELLEACQRDDISAPVAWLRKAMDARAKPNGKNDPVPMASKNWSEGVSADGKF